MALALIGLGGRMAAACPFCSATAQTLSEEIANSDAVVLARLAKPATGADDADANRPRTFGPVDPDTGIARFEIVEVLQGAPLLLGVKEIETVFFGTADDDRIFFITGIDAAPLEWTTPLPLSEAAVSYIKKLSTLPAEGPDRLTFFQGYFEHEDNLLALDAYEEFARAPYDEVIALRDRMNHDRLVELITDPAVSPNRRRLYLTMLGVCGSEADLALLRNIIVPDYRKVAPVVEGATSTALAMGGPLGMALVPEMLETQQRRDKAALDATIACYLTLGGSERLDLIDERFLRNPDAEITHVYSTIMALRFHGEETDVIPRERLLQSVRLLLDHPDFADQVIPDLARWEDWTVLDKLREMYKSSQGRSFVRQPIVTYMTVAAEQEGEVGEEATAALEELESFDPESFDRARRLMAFGFLSRARPESDDQNATRSGDVVEASEAVEAAATSLDDAAAEVPASDSEGAQPSQDYQNNTDAASPQAAAGDLPPDPADAQFQEQAGLSPDRPAPVDLPQGDAEEAAALSAESDAGGFEVSADEQAAETASSNASTEVAASSNAAGAQPDQLAQADDGDVARPPTRSTESAYEVEPLEPPHTFLIVVVPVAAVGLLTGLFWLILRSGSV